MADFTTQQNQDFVTDIIDRYPLDRIAEWIATNCQPEDIFSEDQLADWAIQNGFVKED